MNLKDIIIGGIIFMALIIVIFVLVGKPPEEKVDSNINSVNNKEFDKLPVWEGLFLDTGAVNLTEEENNDYNLIKDSLVFYICDDGYNGANKCSGLEIGICENVFSISVREAGGTFPNDVVITLKKCGEEHFIYKYSTVVTQGFSTYSVYYVEGEF